MAEEIIEQGYRELADTILEHNPGVDLGRVRAAFELADRAHSGQKRKAGTPYVTHCVAAAQICAEMGLDEDSIVAALLHDCIEDTAITHEDIARQFGAEVADIVEGVTKLTRVQFTSREDEQMENLRKMLMAMAKDIRVILIKIADRLHNMRTMEYMVTQKQLEKSLETMEIYAPIAHRLGLQKVKWELEDLSLKYLDPDGYREIITYLDSKADVLNKFMSDVEKKITDRLTEYSIHATVQSRIKHTYSIYRKMYTQKRGLDEIFDLCAFRVIVDDIPDCYNVLGHIHDMFRPVPGRFKDYIATPKPNGYQSVHTTVLGEEGIMFEVQIRTWEMHRISEYGIAAHWKYKSGGAGVRAGDEEKFAWIRRLLEAQQDTDAQDFVHDLKMDMFNDEVFVFTPQGDVVNLPAGACPIDFAYGIHSAVGNRMIGAKVNGRIVPFDYTLQNGDIVDIITSKSAPGPSRDWLSIAKTSGARTKIRAWFKKERRDENISEGKTQLEREIRRNKMRFTEEEYDKILTTLCERQHCNSFDDFYAAIGYGGIPITRLMPYIRDEYHKIFASEQPEKIKITEKSQKTKHASGEGVTVDGIDNCLIKLSRCCAPIPGDEIIGFITRGHGVSIHKRDCPNVPKHPELDEEPERWIAARWNTGTDGKEFKASLMLTCESRVAMMADIANTLADMHVMINSINTRDGKNGIDYIYLTVTVKSIDFLNVVVSRLKSISGVDDVTRRSNI